MGSSEENSDSEMSIQSHGSENFGERAIKLNLPQQNIERPECSLCKKDILETKQIMICKGCK